MATVITKEEVASTLEAVQNIQTISQALQKSKEIYNAKTVEQERLRKEGATQRDVDKAGVKAKKATETYRSYVEKYATAKSEFEQKMAETAQKFQDIEESHILHMKEIIQSYSQSVDETHIQIGELHNEFVRNIENTSVESLIQKLAESKGTGKERPGPIEFEECNTAIATEGAKPRKRKPFGIPGRRKDKDTDSTESTEVEAANTANGAPPGYYGAIDILNAVANPHTEAHTQTHTNQTVPQRAALSLSREPIFKDVPLSLFAHILSLGLTRKYFPSAQTCTSERSYHPVINRVDPIKAQFCQPPKSADVSSVSWSQSGSLSVILAHLARARLSVKELQRLPVQLRRYAAQPAQNAQRQSSSLLHHFRPSRVLLLVLECLTQCRQHHCWDACNPSPRPLHPKMLCPLPYLHSLHAYFKGADPTKCSPSTLPGQSPHLQPKNTSRLEQIPPNQQLLYSYPKTTWLG
ncbi:F-BAR domain only protein 2 isoform X10 [Lates japonicus]|uniref:F-BAR domain only protein 2 isoform X10 n=1 Tax=Lates japonicus TaxID=270547 RepID=A0AAD3RHM7_LATJO|nr:F-BAR domain only protein 2 isoform X10 [Lates japonicus]